MGETLGQPEREPTATPSPTPAEPEPQAILEYRGPMPLPTTPAGPAPRPISLSLTAGLVYFVAGALVVLGGIAVCVSERASPYPGVPISILVVLSGAGLMMLEYGAETRRSRGCALAVGIVCALSAVPLGLMIRREMPFGLDHAAAPTVLTAIAIFCALTHFLWAARLPRPPRQV